MRIYLVSGLAMAVLCLTAEAQQRAPQNDSITQADLRADLFFVSADSMRGRLTDTEENRATADFIRSRFERLGLKPAAPNGSYFENYNLMTATLAADASANQLEIAADAGARRLHAGQEFYPHRFSASGVASGAVVFVGFGISAPHLGYSDYRGDVKGSRLGPARSPRLVAKLPRRRRCQRVMSGWRSPGDLGSWIPPNARVRQLN